MTDKRFDMSDYERKIISQAKFDYIQYHGQKDIKSCVKDAIHETMSATSSQFYSMFGIHERDYIDYLCNKIKEVEAINEKEKATTTN